MKILDVGSAWIPHGDVNLDVSRSRLRGRIKNPVVADAHHLPFRDDVFSLVYSRALLEHVANPTEVVREMIRVAKDEVFFIVPHRYFRRHPPGHRNFFSCVVTREWIRGIVGRLPFMRVVRRGFPSEVVPLIRLPHLLEVRIPLGEDV